MTRHGPRAEMFYRTYEALGRWYLDHGVVLTAVDGAPDVAERIRRIGPEAVVLWGAGRDHPDLAEGPWRTIHTEQGWFPQSRTLYFDDAGVCGDAMRGLAPESTGDNFRRWRDAHLQEFWHAHATSLHTGGVIQPVPSPPYVLVLGQCESDLSLEWSAVHRMQELVGLALASTELPVVFRPHPASYPAVDAHPRLQVVRYSPLYPTIDQATAVVGCTSTSLLESALIGRPTLALGRGAWPEGRRAVWRVEPDDLPAALDAAPREWMPEAAWPWLNALRQVQVDLRAPAFDHPRNRKVLLHGG